MRSAYDSIYRVKISWCYKMVLVMGFKSVMDGDVDRDRSYNPMVQTLKVRYTNDIRKTVRQGKQAGQHTMPHLRQVHIQER